MSKIPTCSSTFGAIKSSKIMDLPANTSDAAEIDTTDDRVTQLSIQGTADFYFCRAANATAAAAAITAKNMDLALANMRYGIPVVGIATDKIFVRAIDATAVSDGIAYSLIEGDRE